MKKDLSTLEIRQLVNELQFLVNGRFEKIYQLSPKDFVLKVHSPNASAFLKISGKFVYLCNDKGNVPEKPSTFCTILRKIIENKKIKKIWQKESERIVAFETESSMLLVELFGQGNVVLCDSDYKVISASRIQKEGRVIKQKEKYEFPEGKKNVFKLSEKDFLELIKSSNSEIVKAIAGMIGGVYAEEVCLRAGIDKSAKEIEDCEIKKLYKSFQGLISEEPSPMVVFGETPVDAVIFDLQIYDGKNKVAFSAFYEALDSYLSQATESEKESAVEKKYQAQIEKIENIIAIQEKSISGLESESAENQKIGEMIYEKYQEISGLMKELEDARKKMSWQEIKSKIKNKKIISVDEKNAAITVDL